MAFTRDELRNIGIADENIDKIMAVHGEEIQKVKSQLDQEKEKAKSAQNEVKMYKQRIDEQSGQLDELKNKVNSGEDLSKQVEALKEANKEKDKAHSEAIRKMQLDHEIERELSRTGAKNNIAVMALVDSDKLHLDDDGNLIGLSEQIKPLKETDGYLFNDTETDNSNSDKQSQPNNDEQSSKEGNDYNAGSGKGNHGSPKNEQAIGIQSADRLLGGKK